ncbi:uncharacterized protein LOC114246096 [Bombyx mandarina]|uniref:COMM domain-containing protein n=2 Tax=Bombyx TaxID=7090 RepID=A0A8R2AKT0_BOMMO|nr:uncharacterized protein LOC101742736 [Bombyx mori]XP_028034283.1 uncharacterized protein LOC114246096 [Bombyx mandarina]
MDIIFKKINSIEHFDIICNEIINNMYTRSDEKISEIVENNVIQTAKQELRTIISTNKYDINMIIEHLNTKDWNQEKLIAFLDLLKKKLSDIVLMSIYHHNCSYGEVITSFDWLLKLVLGSSESKTSQYPILQLITSSINFNGEANTMIYDLDKEMVLRMINSLERVIT